MITISLDNESNDKLKALIDAMDSVATKQVFPETSKRLSESAEIVKTLWQDWATGETALSGIGKIDKPSVSLAKSIQVRNTGMFSREIYTEHKLMQQIQDGTPDVEYDMKQTHPYGRRSRMSKKGIPYLIIPFRWGTPNKNGTKRARFNNVIPSATYRTMLKGFEMSSRTQNTHSEKNAKGENVERSEYKWGSRLKLDKGNRLDGLVRMLDDSSDKLKSTYFTFRIISAKSPTNSWIYKREGKPSLDVTSAIQEELQASITEYVIAGIEEDLMF